MRFLENWERCQTGGLPHPAPFNAPGALYPARLHPFPYLSAVPGAGPLRRAGVLLPSRLSAFLRL